MPGRVAEKEGPNPVDIHVGKRLRLRRTLMGLSQEQLAHALGLTFQQLQKYESGRNRISASRLYELSQILDTPVTYFFEERDEAGNSDTESDPPVELMSKRETLEFVRYYFRISDPVVRQSILKLVKAMAD